MAILSEEQMKKSYFDIIGGFPPAKVIKEVREYNGEEKICVACTQLDSHHSYLNHSKSDLKRILKDWVDFLTTNSKALKALHFNSSVPQILFDAACCQKDLEELRFKWGTYSELSSLEQLRHLKFLYLGQSSRVQDIEVLGKIKSLVVLHIEALKKIEDFSPLVTLGNLEQLVIWGPMLGKTPIKDIEFLRTMQNLRSISIGNVTFVKKYTYEELVALRNDLPYLHDISNTLFEL